MACMFTRTKKIIKQKCGVRCEEVKLNSANPRAVPHALLFVMAPGEKSSSAPSLAAWPLPSFSHLFLHFFVPPPPLLAPFPLLLCPLPLAQPRRGCSSRMVQAGVAGRDAHEPPLPACSMWCWSASSDSLVSWQRSWHWLLDGHYGMANPQCSVDRSNRLEIAWGRCCCEA